MLNEHELRRTIVAEMHLRRWPRVGAPCTIVQVVKLVEPDQREREQALLEALPDGGAFDKGSNPKHRSGIFAPGVHFGWEAHSEASNMTLFLSGDEAERLPISDANGTAADRALAWALGMPGKVIRATRLAITETEEAAAKRLLALDFDPQELVSCHIGCSPDGPAARIWSDFKLRMDGFGLIVVAANGMSEGDLSRTIQRLQELGNYRNLALLGLPVAQQGWKVLDQIAAELGELTGRVARTDVTDDALLDEVTHLSMHLATEATASDFRMGATEAYATIVEERLEDLCIRPIEGYQSLTDFTQRRLFPAVRTCAAHRRRAEQLSQRTAQFVSLFRTRVETRIENQNAKLLKSMDSNAQRQLRLQQLVEGFSVVALTYYGMSLVHHILEGLEEAGLHMPVGIIVAAMTPVVALGMWFGIHRLKNRILR